VNEDMKTLKSRQDLEAELEAVSADRLNRVWERDEARMEAGRIAAEACGLREELQQARWNLSRVEGEARHWHQQAEDAIRERDAARKELGEAWAQRDAASSGSRKCPRCADRDEPLETPLWGDDMDGGEIK